MTEYPFKGVCPFCKSNDIEVEDSTPVEWGNNDQGVTAESWNCNNCKSFFNTEGRVEVTYRKLLSYIKCPYCENDAKKMDPDKDEPTLEWYWCDDCKREFAIHPQKWYEELEE